MTTCRQYALLFWAAALFLVIGGQFAHGIPREDSCSGDHASEQHHSTSEECPTGHQCCKTHSQAAISLAPGAHAPRTDFVSCRFGGQDESPLEGARARIDHPPQLS